MTDTLRDKLIQKGWVTPFNADTLVRLIEEHYADEPAAPAPPADGEVAGLVEMLKGIAYWRLHGTDKPTPFDIRQAARLTRAAELLQRARAALAEPVAEPPEGEVAKLVAWLHGQDGGLGRRAIYARIAELLERHAAPVPKLALAPANDYKSRWLEEDGVMKPVINWIHTIPIEDKDIFHCAQSSCWCSPKVDKDNPEIILHQALTSAQDGWVLIGEIEAASEKPDSLASPPPSELIAELIPELRKVAEHLRDCNFRGFSNYVARAAELLGRQVPPEVGE